MANECDLTVTTCPHCKGLPIAPIIERPVVRVQLNGENGTWPAAKINQGDIIEIAFRKNGAAWQQLPKGYEVKVGPLNGNELIAYITFKLEEQGKIV